MRAQPGCPGSCAAGAGKEQAGGTGRAAGSWAQSTSQHRQQRAGFVRAHLWAETVRGVGGFTTSVTAKWMRELPGVEQVSASLEGLPLGVGLSGHLTNGNGPVLCLPPQRQLSPPTTAPSPPSPLFITAFHSCALGNQKLGMRAWLALKREGSQTLDALEKHQPWHWLPACLSLQMALPLLLLPPAHPGSSVFPLGAATRRIRPSFSFSPQLQISCWILLWEDAIWLPDLSAFTLA